MGSCSETLYSKVGNITADVVDLKEFAECLITIEALQKGDQPVIQKLENNQCPERELGHPDLSDLIDVTALQVLMDNFYKLAHIPMSIVDLKGKLLVGVGWQDICTKFHRTHPDTRRLCLESDVQLSRGISPGKFRLYKCRNNLWDIATPIMVGDQHVGNVFSGQFFFDDELVDYDLYRSQARQYGFNEEEYISALKSVPHFSRETIITGINFLIQLTELVSKLSYSNIKPTRSLAERDCLMDSLRKSEERLADDVKFAIEAANLERQRAQAIEELTRASDDLEFRVHAELRQSEAQHRQIIEASPDAYFVFAHNKIKYANPAAQQLFSYENTNEMDITALKSLFMPERYQKSVDIEDYSKPIHLGEITITKETGLIVTVEGIIVPIVFEGEAAYQYIIRDITQRKEIEKEMARLDRLNLIGEMAAGIGHEIRNPMTTVRGFLQILGDKEECSKYKGNFDLMIDELDRANSIISEYLKLARNNNVERNLINLNDIIKTLLPLIQSDAMKSENKLILELEGIPDLLMDEKEVRQVIFNLVRNGLEASPLGSDLTIRTFADGDDIVLAIQDNGEGISPDVLEKIGTPFFTTKDNGTGLGLAVCYSIANRHNAKIEIKSNSGGTTFFVRFKQTH